MSDPIVERAIARILKQPDAGSGGCPDANDLAAWLESRLSPEEAKRFEEHASRCEACREAMAMCLNMAEPEPESDEVAAAKSFTYRSSPLRLVFAAVVLVIVGVLLFQSLRPSASLQPASQIATNRELPEVFSGGNGAAISSQKTQSDAAKNEEAAGSTPKPRAKAASEIQASAPSKTEPPADSPVLAANTAVPPGNQRLETLQNAQLPAGPTTAQNALAVQAPTAANRETNRAQNTLQVPERQAGLGQQASVGQQVAVPDSVSKTVRSVSGKFAEEISAAISQKSGQEKEEMPNLRISQALAEAQSLLAKGDQSGKARKIGARTFYRTANYWVDAESVSHAEVQTKELGRDSKEFMDWSAKDAQLSALKDAPILIYANQTNYLIR
jgi:hypothetical protein